MNHPYRSSAPAVSASQGYYHIGSLSASPGRPRRTPATASSSAASLQAPSGIVATTAMAMASAMSTASSSAAAASAAREQQLREDDDHAKCASNQHARLASETLATLKQQLHVLRSEDWMFEHDEDFSGFRTDAGDPWD